MVGVREEHQREVASLTKIMTTIVSMELFERYSMERGKQVEM
jgi:D-alanyl-D-alanine carboxypeptidase